MIIGRPTNRNPLKYFVYHDIDDSYQFYKIKTVGNKRKCEYLFTKYPNSVITQNQSNSNIQNDSNKQIETPIKNQDTSKVSNENHLESKSNEIESTFLNIENKIDFDSDENINLITDEHDFI